MKTTTAILGWALVAMQACATVAPQPLNLPPRDAPIEHRVAAYRAHAAMPQIGFNGWNMRLGDGEVTAVDEARPFMANSPEAESVMRARDRQAALGWSLMGGGLALMLASVAVLPFELDSSDRTSVPILPFTLIALGAGAVIPGTFVMGASQRRLPSAAEAYNHWLWDRLALPRVAPDGRLLVPVQPPTTPHPATPSTSTPWSAP